MSETQPERKRKTNAELKAEALARTTGGDAYQNEDGPTPMDEIVWPRAWLAPNNVETAKDIYKHMTRSSTLEDGKRTRELGTIAFSAWQNVPLEMRRKIEADEESARASAFAAAKMAQEDERQHLINGAIELAAADGGNDPGALFEPKMIAALCFVRRTNVAEYARIRGIITSRKIPVGRLEKAMDYKDKHDKSVEASERVLSINREVDNVVEQLNLNYAHVLLGGKARIAMKTESKRFEFLLVDSFHSHYANDRLKVDTEDGRHKEVPISRIWIKHESRQTFDGVVFEPRGAPKGKLNLWRGFAVTPIPSGGVFWSGLRCRKFLSHVKYNICNGDRAQFRYLIRWCADIFQNPGRKPGVAVSISGKKGVGKSKFAETLAALLGQHAVTVSQSRHLTGNFNAHLAQAILVAAEEAYWAGDKAAEGALKDMITSGSAMVEPKGVDAQQVNSYCRIVFNSNEPWIYPATADERRLAAFACGDKHQRDYEYFAAIDDQLYGKGKREYVVGGEEKPPAGLRALLTFFMRLDLSEFNVRAAIETDALADQRMATLKPHEQFLLECVENRTIGMQSASDFDYNKEPAPWGEEERLVSKTDLYEQFIHSNAARGKRHVIANNAFGRWIKSNFRWKTYREQIGREMKVGYYWKVPPYEAAHKKIVEVMKIRIGDDDE